MRKEEGGGERRREEEELLRWNGLSALLDHFLVCCFALFPTILILNSDQVLVLLLL